MAEILSGKPVADAIADEAKRGIETLRPAGVVPCLAIFRVGDDAGDISYERGAARRMESLGVDVRFYRFETCVSQEDFVRAVREASADDAVHGILLLRPLPGHIDDAAVRQALASAKDVDGITDGSLAGIYAGADIGFAPCTAEACVRMLDYYNIPVQGKRALVVGRSLVIGKPVAMLLLGRHATVTVCHSRSVDIEQVCAQSDIIVAATGNRDVLSKKCFRSEHVVLDVGIHVDAEGRLTGDVDFEEAESIVQAITPVPGGIGSVTTAVLANHVVSAALRQVRHDD